MRTLLAVVMAAFVFIPPEAEKFDVYAVRFATIANFPVSSLISGADRSRRLDIAMTVWVLKGVNGRVALVDSGFHRDQYFTSFAVKDFVLPSEAIAPLGIKPEEVTDIFLSHMHWDHAGGIDADDVLEIVKRNTMGRVTLVRGEDETSISGIGFHVGGKHTWQSQFVSVQTRAGGTVVLASDNVYLYKNLDTHKPIAQTLDADSNLRTQDRMRSLASALKLVVPDHDPAVFDRFPHISDRIVKIE